MLHEGLEVGLPGPETATAGPVEGSTPQKHGKFNGKATFYSRSKAANARQPDMLVIGQPPRA